jgi:hypothetical protein
MTIREKPRKHSNKQLSLNKSNVCNHKWKSHNDKTKYYRDRMINHIY